MHHYNIKQAHILTHWPPILFEDAPVLFEDAGLSYKGTIRSKDIPDALIINFLDNDFPQQ